jgi:hypothetical protein
MDPMLAASLRAGITTDSFIIQFSSHKPDAKVPSEYYPKNE